MEMMYDASDQGRAINSLHSDAVQQCISCYTLDLVDIVTALRIKKDGRNKGVKKKSA